MEGNPLNLKSRPPLNLHRLHHRPIELRNVERHRLQFRHVMGGEQMEIRIEDVEPQPAARLQVRTDALQQFILARKRRETQERIEEDADPVESLVKLEL